MKIFLTAPSLNDLKMEVLGRKVTVYPKDW